MWFLFGFFVLSLVAYMFDKLLSLIPWIIGGFIAIKLFMS